MFPLQDTSINRLTPFLCIINHGLLGYFHYISVLHVDFLTTCPWEHLSWFKEQSSLKGKGHLQQPNVQDNKPREDWPPGLNGGKD